MFTDFTLLKHFCKKSYGKKLIKIKCNAKFTSNLSLKNHRKLRIFIPIIAYIFHDKKNFFLLTITYYPYLL